MFALLQLYPLEATLSLEGQDDDLSGVDVLAIDASHERLEQLAADYEQRYQAAQAEWDAWDDPGCEWSEAHDRKAAELERKHHVCSPTIAEMRWQIVEVWGSAPPEIALVA